MKWHNFLQHSCTAVSSKSLAYLSLLLFSCQCSTTGITLTPSVSLTVSLRVSGCRDVSQQACHGLAECWSGCQWDWGSPFPALLSSTSWQTRSGTVFLSSWQPFLWETSPGQPCTPWHAPSPINIASPFSNLLPLGLLLRVRTDHPTFLRLDFSSGSRHSREQTPRFLHLCLWFFVFCSVLLHK